MKVAVVGTGISGMTSAYLLAKSHDVHVFEASDYVGGHTNTIALGDAHGNLKVDTGFIVFNDWTYPNFIKLMDQLGVESQPTAMSFSVSCEKSGLEYNGTTLNSLFAQRKNIFSPKFLQMIRDILRFNRESLEFLEGSDHEITLGAFLRQGKYSDLFKSHYIIPMGAAVWSTGPRTMEQFPARYFISFFKNHGMLSVNNRPQWRVIKGGSQSYVPKITAGYKDRIRLNTPVRQIRRTENEVFLRAGNSSGEEKFDSVILACHSDQALALLSDADDLEKDVMGCFAYTQNSAVLHTDVRLLPKRPLAWAAWNYRLAAKGSDDQNAAVTYNMNILQTLESKKTYCVSLNADHCVAPEHVIKTISYQHPQYSLNAVKAQQRHGEINGRRRTYFCGAYWGYGFHEDGVKSALAVTKPYFDRGL